MALVDARQKLKQIRRNKNKKDVSKVKDLRQLIKSKKRSDSQDRSFNGRVSGGRVTKSTNNRDSNDANKRYPSGRNASQTRDGKSIGGSRNPDRLRSRLGANSRSLSSTRNQTTVSKNYGQSKARKTPQALQIHYYVPPHLQQQQQQSYQAPQAQPTYIIAPPQSNLAMDNTPGQSSTSILVSNLTPGITQSEIIELFGDIGALGGVCMIDQSTAIVAFQNSSDAFRAVKMYHNRLLDGKPMNVNLMPTSMVPASNVRSRIGQNPLVGSSHGVAPMEIAFGARR